MVETTIAKKLLIKPGHSMLLLHAPENYRDQLGTLPVDVEIIETPEDASPQAFDCVLLFASDQSQLASRAPLALSSVRPNGMLWIAYPKKTSQLNTDLSRDAGWDAVTSAGMQGVSLIALDETWSAMRFRLVAQVTKR